MAQQLKGVSGVLGNIISAEPEQKPFPERPAESRESSRDVSRAVPDQQKGEEKASKPPKRNGAARRGLPPKPPRTSEPIEREKVSLRLRADLAATYRDWSWEERCQFSELVDRAMEFYLRHREKGRKPEKT